jgi:hypothetical protein
MLLPSWLWYRAGQRQTRRISKLEVLDAADLNRVVTAVNRSAILNKRAALASAFSAACFALRFGASLLADVLALG